MDLQWCESSNERMIFAYSSVWVSRSWLSWGSHMMLCPVFMIVTLAWNWKTQQNCYMNSYITGCFSYYCWTKFVRDEYTMAAESPLSECHQTNIFNSSNRMFKIFNAINVNHLLGKIPNFEYFVIKIGWSSTVIYSFWQKLKSVLGSSWWF